jgi:hypothetical protein
MIEDLLRIVHRRDFEDHDPGLELLALSRSRLADRELRERASEHLSTHREDAEALLYLDAFEARQKTPRFLRSALSISSMVALAASIALFFLAGARPSSTLQPKGIVTEPKYELYLGVEREGQRFLIADGAALRAGDRVGFFYTASERAYFAVIHRDAEGNATTMYPASGEKSAPIKPGKNVPLPDAAGLEQSAGCEHFVGIFSAQPLSMTSLAERVAAAKSGEDCALDVELDDDGAVRVFRIMGIEER